MTSKTSPKLNLALQGGGSHGAYTWGVLDRLLEEESITIDGISGTSAGAMNAAVLACGYEQGGRAGAQKLLRQFWERVAQVGEFSPISFSPLGLMKQDWNLDHSFGYRVFDLLSRMMSPYDVNPYNLNPLRSALEETINISQLQGCNAIKLFITATNVRTGQPKVFRCKDMSIDALLASACLPFMFQAIEIDGEAYWDGGYMGNPAIWPLIYYTESSDIMLVQINPLVVKEVPKKASEIIDRLNEITFNSSLLAEMRAIDFVGRLVEEHQLPKDKYKRLRMHMIETPAEMEKLNASSKLNATLDFFHFLHKAGRGAADKWLQQHQQDIGVKSSLDIGSGMLGRRPKLDNAAE